MRKIKAVMSRTCPFILALTAYLVISISNSTFSEKIIQNIKMTFEQPLLYLEGTFTFEEQ